MDSDLEAFSLYPTVVAELHSLINEQCNQITESTVPLVLD